MQRRHPILFVSWRSPRTHTIHPVGRLVHRDDLGLYEFVYIRNAREAGKEGFLPFLDFPDLERIYQGERLFPLFANRILSSNRPDFREYTEGLGLSPEGADPMRILARTAGRRETDLIEMFPLPVPDATTGAYTTHCLIRGIRYMPQPFVEHRIARLERGEPLYPLWDVRNKIDPNAVAVRTIDFAMIGYLPAYLARDVRRIGDDGMECSVRVERVNPPPAGIHHRLLCRVEGVWPKGFIPYDADEFQPLSPKATDLDAWTAPEAAPHSRGDLLDSWKTKVP